MPMTPEESFIAATAEPEVVETAAAEAVEPAADEQTNATRVNPAWEEAWADVPTDIRERQQSHFDKWDRNYKHLETRFAPYKEYEEAGIDPSYIQQAIQIQQALVENPRGFYDQMAQNWGFTPAQAADAAAVADPFESEEDSRLSALQARLDEIDSRQTSWQQQQQRATAEREQVDYVEQQLGGLGEKVGDFDRNAVVERAILNATTGRNPSIEVAYYEIKAQEDAILARHQRTAPRVLGAGGAPATASAQAPAAPLTNEQRLEKAMGMAKQIVDGMNHG